MSKKEVEDLHDAPDADEVAAAVKEGLRSYNRSMRPDPSAAPVTLAGLVGHTGWGWLEIETLWVDESRRGAGLGRVLIARAEQIARVRGCHSAHLDTLGFQAPGFYEQLGYEAFGVLERYPDVDHIFYRKRLIELET